MYQNIQIKNDMKVDDADKNRISNRKFNREKIKTKEEIKNYE